MAAAPLSSSCNDDGSLLIVFQCRRVGLTSPSCPYAFVDARMSHLSQHTLYMTAPPRLDRGCQAVDKMHPNSASWSNVNLMRSLAPWVDLQGGYQSTCQRSCQVTGSRGCSGTPTSKNWEPQQLPKRNTLSMLCSLRAAVL